MRPFKYEYIGTLRDPRYFRDLVAERLGISPPGITTYADRFVIWADVELTPEQKTMLDSLVGENPVPTAVYEIAPVSKDDVEAEVGIRPVFLYVDPATGEAICQFDTTLTPEQEAKLEELLRSPMRFKKKP